MQHLRGEIVGVYDFLKALQDVILASDPAKREILSQTMIAWGECDPELYGWAMGMQAPALLHNVMMEIAVSPESFEPATESKRACRQKNTGQASLRTALTLLITASAPRPTASTKFCVSTYCGI
jgi:hypothetical protein